MGIIDSLPMVKAVVSWGLDKIPEEYAKDSRVFTWKNFMDLGKNVPTKDVEVIMDKQKPGQCCVLIYTSGTTGNPKGVMLSHDNLIFNGTSMGIDILESAPKEEVIEPHLNSVVSYLPLSHIAGLQQDLTTLVLFGS